MTNLKKQYSHTHWNSISHKAQAWMSACNQAVYTQTEHPRLEHLNVKIWFGHSDLKYLPLER